MPQKKRSTDNRRQSAYQQNSISRHRSHAHNQRFIRRLRGAPLIKTFFAAPNSKWQKSSQVFAHAAVRMPAARARLPAARRARLNRTTFS